MCHQVQFWPAGSCWPWSAWSGRRRRAKVTVWNKSMGGLVVLGVLAIVFLIWWVIWLKRG